MRYIELDEVHSEKAIREICEEFPFLIPKTGGKVVPDYDYTYLWLEIPRGWYNLFLQMCVDIKPILEKYNMLDSFEFVQVKEKYNRLRCYHNLDFDYDNGLIYKEIENILIKYECMSWFVCTQCGNIATHVTCRGWISSYCKKCIDNSEYLTAYLTEDVIRKITKFEPYYTINSYGIDVIQIKVSFEDEWNRYKNLIGAE